MERKRLLSDKEWKMAAYEEFRSLPTHGLQRGKNILFPQEKDLLEPIVLLFAV